MKADRPALLGLAAVHSPSRKRNLAAVAALAAAFAADMAGERGRSPR